MPDNYTKIECNTPERDSKSLPAVWQNFYVDDGAGQSDYQVEENIAAFNADEPVLVIKWQDQNPANGINGVTMEMLLQVMVDRLDEFDVAGVGCRENSLIRTKLQEALHWQKARGERIALEKAAAAAQ